MYPDFLKEFEMSRKTNKCNCNTGKLLFGQCITFLLPKQYDIENLSRLRCMVLLQIEKNTINDFFVQLNRFNFYRIAMKQKIIKNAKFRGLPEDLTGKFQKILSLDFGYFSYFERKRTYLKFLFLIR